MSAKCYLADIHVVDAATLRALGLLPKFRASETFKHDQRLRDRISGDPLVATVLHWIFSRFPIFRPDFHAFISAAASDFSGSPRRPGVLHWLCCRTWRRIALALSRTAGGAAALVAGREYSAGTGLRDLCRSLSSASRRMAGRSSQPPQYATSGGLKLHAGRFSRGCRRDSAYAFRALIDRRDPRRI